MPLLLLRHASAGDRDAWRGEDRARPLDKRGRRQAEAVVALLSPYRIEAILTSPAVRCLQTVEPIASARHVDLEVREELAEDRQETDGGALVRSLAGRDIVVCGHGGLERALPASPRWRKGTTLIVGPDLAVVDVLRS
jgi:8-oxo-dGTP diphosphatase